MPSIAAWAISVFGWGFVSGVAHVAHEALMICADVALWVARRFVAAAKRVDRVSDAAVDAAELNLARLIWSANVRCTNLACDYFNERALWSANGGRCACCDRELVPFPEKEAA